MINQLDFTSQEMKMVVYSENNNSTFCFKEKTVDGYNGLENTYMTKVHIGADFKNILKSFIGKIKNFRIYSDIISIINRVSFGICLACEIGYYYDEVGNKCVKCFAICLKCLNQNIDSCISCVKGYSLLVKQNFSTFSTGTCVLNCPKSFFKSYPFLNEQSSFKNLLTVDQAYLNKTKYVMFKNIFSSTLQVKNGFLYFVKKNLKFFFFLF